MPGLSKSMQKPVNANGVRHITRSPRRVLGLEALESRTPLAADICETLHDLDHDSDLAIRPLIGCIAMELLTPPIVNVGNDLDGPNAVATKEVVELVLTVTDSSGSPITTASVGDDFVLHVSARDLRAAPSGVFAPFLD